MVTLRSLSKWHIDVLVKEDCVQKEWRFTGFYGSPYLKDRNFVWNLLRRLGQEGHYPWLVARDFNEILYSFEKNGGVLRDQERMEAFRETLEECQLMDIGYSGVWFTWERGNLPETNIKERLGRGVANEEWLLLFPMGNIQHLPYSTSDHCPILINTDSSIMLSGCRRFHFEAWWTMKESFEDVIREFWESSSVTLVEKLMHLQIHLKQWACSNKSKKDGLKMRLTKELETLLGKERDDETLAKIIDTKIHLNMEIDKDEMYWEQRARANWLQLGDKNTAYFHKCATVRERTNSITKLVSNDGREITEGSKIIEAATEYFEDLFASKELEILGRCWRAWEDEVRTSLKGIGPTKALGSNGFPSLFFQKYWHTVGKEVMEYCLSILNRNEGIESVNVTEIVLILKISNPSTLVNFRPISLCSVIYKIVAKTVANRLQNVISMCIDEVQSAFVPSRLIIDNVLLAYEILYTFRQKRTGNKGYMALKLDMSKAYDRVEWDFVKEMMIKMGFANEWVGLIMKCISSVSYAVNINGSRGRIFQPTRGLRQSDPLSPFLFLICGEGLSSLLRSAKQKGFIKGAKASRRGPEISHLLFADDCIMFGEATEQGARNMKDILKEYESCSGQCVNFNKSAIFYSSNTTAEAKELVSTMLGVRSSSSPEKYLGLPNVVDKISLRIESWSNRLLSQGGKEVFIKSVLQALPTYAILLDFDGKKELASEVSTGANGDIYVVLKNEEVWDSLVARVFKAKYFSYSNFRNSRLGRSSSYVWRSIWATKDTSEKGLIWKVGTGKNISVFEDAWIPNYDNVRLTSGVCNLQFVKVAELINSNEREWNRELIGNTFPEAKAELILRIPLAMEPHEDLLVWNGELSGEFSVRSSYKLLQNFDPTAYALQNIYRDFYSKLWRIDIPTKIKIFIWKTSWNYLATWVNMTHRRLTSSSLCPRCANGEETVNHLFRNCPVSVIVWRDLSDTISVLLPYTEFVEWLTKVMALLSLNQCRKFCVALWAIWGDRNFRIHDKTNRSSQEIVSFIHSYIKELDGVRKVNQSISTEAVKWNNPPGQAVKINFDGAFNERTKQSASGVVARDSNGHVIITSIELYREAASAFVAEAIACRRATQIALDINREDIIIEGDSLFIIKKCNSRGFDKSQVGSYIQDIHGLKSRAKSVRFEFVLRSANNLAHILATESLKRKERIYLMNGVPCYAEIQAEKEYAREPD
ncbi:reverse transcriptase [Gossypium australe]|uniref:Reverse transcriptase n=1 Tax=Gossypium australe TaxID=47621 RepID=A0A5B6UV86_9ROSI|nr:reverse transcriptase [Gossypium australe]